MSLCCKHAVLTLHVTVHAVLTVEVGQARQYFLHDKCNEVLTETISLLVHGSHQIRHRAIGTVLQASRYVGQCGWWVEYLFKLTLILHI